MHMTRRRLTRLFGVVAIVTAVLVPAVSASAAAYLCDGIVYNSANPAHVLYGAVPGTPINADGLMVVDVSGAAQGMVVFWDGDFSVDPSGGGAATGAWIAGSPFGDTICGTDGADTVKGNAGNDKVIGNGDDDYLKG
ncbi:MAG TPA: hypothetical protein VJP05_00855, partial [Acidimicrobiia bacterium]|nr:hypothetical protein [Acidimicrobiia bacterium]